MKRFLITSQKFAGTAEIFYNADGVLCKIDTTDTGMNALTIAAFKRTVSATVDEVASVFSPGTTIVEAEFTVSFEMFWKKYDKKINKVRCMKLWDKMNQTEQVQAFFGVDAYHKFLKKESWGRGKADPETYMRNKYWENEYK